MLRNILILLLTIFLFSCSANNEYSLDEQATYENIDLPRAAKFNLQLGMGYLEQGDVERAKGKFLKALKQSPKMPEVHYNMAHFYYLIDEYKLADSHFKKAIRFAKGSSKGVLGTARNNYGVFLCQTKKYDAAEFEFLTAIDDPDYADTASAYENAGLCALKANSPKKAKQYFQRAIKQNPLSTKALIEVADLYYKDNEITNARFYLDRYHQLTSSSKRSMLLSLRIANQEDNPQLVESLTQAIIDKYPNIKSAVNEINIGNEKYSKNNKSPYNDKLVKYTEIGELSNINKYRYS